MNTPSNVQTVTNRHALAYVGIILATVLLGSFGQQLAAGLVPIPKEWSWLTPVLLAGIVSLTTLLPRVTDTQQNSLAQAGQAATPDQGPQTVTLPGVSVAPIEHVLTVKVAPTQPEQKLIDVAPPAVGAGEAATEKTP
jgi:hypothetical protein